MEWSDISCCSWPPMCLAKRSSPKQYYRHCLLIYSYCRNYLKTQPRNNLSACLHAYPSEYAKFLSFSWHWIISYRRIRVLRIFLTSFIADWRFGLRTSRSRICLDSTLGLNQAFCLLPTQRCTPTDQQYPSSFVLAHYWGWSFGFLSGRSAQRGN